MYDARNVIIRPIVSEKSYTLMEMNKYTFEVDKRATKPHIAQAIQEIFGVTVKGVNTIN
ncbi:MAG: 50S ribosomal protein L23, partial [Actinomycetota bacterium]|nr:50S ribosomal protein L23 [Actinomycetota bacterium]